MEDLLDNGPNRQGPPSQSSLPNATAVLVLGIVSIVGCFLYAIPGIICGIIALVLFKKDKRTYLADPARYEESYKTANAGNICAIIGLSLSCLYLIFWLLLLGQIFSMGRFM